MRCKYPLYFPFRICQRYYTTMDQKYNNMGLQVLHDIKSFVAIKNSLADTSAINMKEKIILTELHKPMPIPLFETNLKKYLDYISALYISRKKADEPNLILDHFSYNLSYRNSKLYESAMLAAKTLLLKEQVLEIWEQIRYFGIEKTPLQYHCIIFVVSMDNMHQAILLFEKAISEGVIPLVTTVNRILNGLLIDNKHQTAIEFFEKNVKHLPTDTRDSITFELLLRACKFLRKDQLVLQYIALQNQEKIIITPTSVEDIRSFSNTKEVTENLILRFQALQNVQVEEQTKKQLTFSTLQQIRICKKQTDLERLFSVIKRTNVISITPELVKTVTLRYMEFDLNHALEFLSTEMHSIASHFPKDSILKQLNFLLQDSSELFSNQLQHLKTIRTQIVYQLYPSLGLQPNIYTFGILMNYAYRRKDIDAVQSLFSKAAPLFPTSNASNLEAVVKPYCLALLESKKYEQILSSYYNLCKPYIDQGSLNSSLLHFVITSHCRTEEEGAFEKAYQLFCEAQKTWNTPFTIQTYTALIQGSWSPQHISQAKQLYSQARQRGMQFTADDLSYFVSKVYFAREFDMIYQIVEQEIQANRVDIVNSTSKGLTLLGERLLKNLMQQEKSEHLQMIMNWIKENNVSLPSKEKRMVMQWLIEHNQVKDALDWYQFASQQLEKKELENLQKMRQQASQRLDKLIAGQ